MDGCGAWKVEHRGGEDKQEIRTRGCGAVLPYTYPSVPTTVTQSVLQR